MVAITPLFLRYGIAEFSISYEGYHLYYPNRRQNSPLFSALVEALKE